MLVNQSMDFDSSNLPSLNQWLWPFLRISGFVLASPIIGTRALPRRIRMVFALALTVVIAPLVVLDANIEALPTLSAEGVLIAAQQLTLGIALGLILRMVFVVFEFAGQVIAQQMGLGFAAMVDPQSGMQVPVISQFYVVLATLFFFASDIHLQLIVLLSESFRILPIGTPIAREALAATMAWSGDFFSLAVVLMLPVIVSLLIVNIVFAVMTRSAPQLNIFAIGFPVTLLFGVAMIFLTLGNLGENLDQTFESSFNAAYGLLRTP
jgi:flagellar biosynthesis protein FliR